MLASSSQLCEILVWPLSLLPIPPTAWPPHLPLSGLSGLVTQAVACLVEVVVGDHIVQISTVPLQFLP